MTITPKHDKNLIVRVFIGKQNQLKQKLSFSHEKNIHLLGLEPGSSSMEVGHVTPRLFFHMMTYGLKRLMILQLAAILTLLRPCRLMITMCD